MQWALADRNVGGCGGSHESWFNLSQMANDTDLHDHRVGEQRRAEAPAAPAIVPLSELGVIAVDGADAVAFLQTQLTNDVSRLVDGVLQLNGYCSVKGRLIATFHQWRDNDAVLLRLPREVLPAGAEATCRCSCCDRR